jgi:Chitin synthase
MTRFSFQRERSRRAVKEVKEEKEEKLIKQIEELQGQLDQMHQLQKQQIAMKSEASHEQSQHEKALVAEIQAMKWSMIELKRKASFQNKNIDQLQRTTTHLELLTTRSTERIEETQKNLHIEIKKTQRDAFLPHEFQELEEEPIDSIHKGSIDVIAPSSGVKWTASGYSSVIPHPDFNYFPRLDFGPRLAKDGINYSYSEGMVISAIVPCYNESGSDLERTIRSLDRQLLPPGWRVEVVIVMDGADHMSESMAEKLYGLFGIKVNSGDAELDPLVALPEAETIIVEPADVENAHLRTPAMAKTVGGYTLVVKRHNHRKANSQMWWLGPHGNYLGTEYSLATDCGTVFSRTATIHLIRRLEAEPSLHAVTGFQRIMTSEMQGDGSWELFHRPFDFLLRMVQRFEFEVCIFASVFSSIKLSTHSSPWLVIKHSSPWLIIALTGRPRQL